MKAVILAGGRGTRLAPYTMVLPKPLVPLGHRPILDIIIRQLAYYGIKDITLTVGYLAELIQAYFTHASQEYADISISYVREATPLGTAGPLRLIPGLDDTFLVMNGDILTTLDYSKIIEFHRANDAILTIGMHVKRVKVDLGVIEVGEANRIVDYIEKPEKTYLVSMGVYVYEPAALKHIDPHEYLDFPDLVCRLINRGEKVVGYQCDEFWMDIGRHEDYVLAQNEFERMKHLFLPFEKI